MKHKHHVQPLYQGGRELPENIIEVSVEEHAEIHKQRWLDNGNIEEYLAWQGLVLYAQQQERIKKDLSEAGKKGALHNHKRKGMKYKPRSGKSKGGLGTTGKKWYHNPNDPTQRTCLSDGELIPEGWIRGQGKKAKNPGLNFHAKRLKKNSAGPEPRIDDS